MTNKTKHAKEPTGNQLLVNISSLVINSAIRTEVKEGVEFTVLPSKTLPPDIVMNRILYEDENVECTIDTLDGSPVTLGHPVVNGKFNQNEDIRDIDYINTNSKNESNFDESYNNLLKKILAIYYSLKKLRLILDLLE